MQLKSAIPSLPEIGREAVIVLSGALLAALIVGRVPSLGKWIREQWQEPAK